MLSKLFPEGTQGVPVCFYEELGKLGKSYKRDVVLVHMTSIAKSRNHMY